MCIMCLYYVHMCSMYMYDCYDIIHIHNTTCIVIVQYIFYSILNCIIIWTVCNVLCSIMHSMYAECKCSLYYMHIHIIQLCTCMYMYIQYTYHILRDTAVCICMYVLCMICMLCVAELSLWCIDRVMYDVFILCNAWHANCC
jgi:hypothetical protein